MKEWSFGLEIGILRYIPKGVGTRAKTKKMVALSENWIHRFFFYDGIYLMKKECIEDGNGIEINKFRFFDPKPKQWVIVNTDISKGQEQIPICVINEKDLALINLKDFPYIAKMEYLNHLRSRRWCNCSKKWKTRMRCNCSRLQVIFFIIAMETYWIKDHSVWVWSFCRCPNRVQIELHKNSVLSL